MKLKPLFHGKSSRSAFTLVEIMIVVAIIGLLAAIAIPNFVKARQTAERNACIANLQQIDGAKTEWALESKASDGATPASTDIAPYLKGNAMPQCPAGGTYSINALGTAPTCSLGPTEGHSL